MPNSSWKEQFRDMLKGDFNRKSLLLYLVCNYSLALLFLALATITLAMEKGFSFLVNDISNTGSPGRNPRGWFFFSIFLVYGGVLMIPVDRFFFKRMKSLDMNAAMIITVFYLTGSIGTALVGVFPSEVSYFMHVLSAGLAFGGYGFGFLIFLGVVIRQKRWQFTWTYIILLPVIAGLMITQGYIIFTANADFDAFRGTIMSVSLWEWLLFFSVILTLIFKAIMLQGAIDAQKNEQ